MSFPSDEELSRMYEKTNNNASVNSIAIDWHSSVFSSEVGDPNDDIEVLERGRKYLCYRKIIL